MHFSDRESLKSGSRKEWHAWRSVSAGRGNWTVGPPFRTGNIRIAFNRFDTERPTASADRTRDNYRSLTSLLKMRQLDRGEYRLIRGGRGHGATVSRSLEHLSFPRHLHRHRQRNLVSYRLFRSNSAPTGFTRTTRTNDFQGIERPTFLQSPYSTTTNGRALLRRNWADSEF